MDEHQQAVVDLTAAILEVAHEGFRTMSTERLRETTALLRDCYHEAQTRRVSLTSPRWKAR